jgi:hypothetical protein
MIVGLASTLPHTLTAGLEAHHVPTDVASQIGNAPPVGSLFAAFLGYNPVRSLLGTHTLSTLPPSDAQTLTGHTFFPSLISGPFHHGLVIVFVMAIAMSVIGAVASMLRGGRYVYDDTQDQLGRATSTSESGLAS